MVEWVKSKGEKKSASSWFKPEDFAYKQYINNYTYNSLIRTRKAEENLESGSKSGLKYYRIFYTWLGIIREPEPKNF